MKIAFLIIGVLLAQTSMAASSSKGMFLEVQLIANSLGSDSFKDSMYCTNKTGNLVLGGTFSELMQNPQLFLVDKRGNATKTYQIRIGDINDAASDVPGQDPDIFGFIDEEGQEHMLSFRESSSQREKTQAGLADLDGKAVQCFGRLIY